MSPRKTSAIGERSARSHYVSRSYSVASRSENAPCEEAIAANLADSCRPRQSAQLQTVGWRHPTHLHAYGLGKAHNNQQLCVLTGQQQKQSIKSCLLHQRVKLKGVFLLVYLGHQLSIGLQYLGHQMVVVQKHLSLCAQLSGRAFFSFKDAVFRSSCIDCLLLTQPPHRASGQRG